jgi:transcription initiation factor TFIIB
MSHIDRQCPNCGPARILSFGENRGSVCSGCGYVLNSGMVEDHQDPNCRGRSQRSLNGPSARWTDGKQIFGLTETNNTACNGASLLEKWQKLAGASDQTEKNIALALSDITKIAGSLSLPTSVLEEASRLYRLLLEKRLIKGRSIQALCAAVVYAASRRQGFAALLNEVAIVSRVDKRMIGRYYRFLVDKLGLSIPHVSMKQCAEALFNRLKVGTQVADIARNIATTMDSSGITSGKDPLGVMSAAIHVASKLIGEKITLRALSVASGLTETTIRSRCRQLEKDLLFIVSL